MKSLLFLILISIVNLSLLLFRIDYQSLWLDEVMSLDVSQSSMSALVKFFQGMPEQHPFYYLLLHGWLFLGTSETVLRSLSVLFGLASLWAVYFLANRLFNESLSRVTVILLCFSPFYIYYGQEARMYTLLSFLAIVNSYFFVSWVQQPCGFSVGGYLVSGVLGVYTHFFFFFLLCAHLCFLLIHERRLGLSLLRVALYQGMIVLSYTPWALLLLFHTPKGQSWKGIEHVVFGVPYTFFRFSLGYAEFIANYQWKEHIGQLLMQTAPTLLLAFMSFGCLALAGFSYMKRSGWQGLFVLCCLIAPMAIALMASVKMILVGERYFIVCFPFYIILIAGGICRFWQMEGKGRTFGVVVSTLFVLLTGKSIYNYYFNPEFGKGQWRDVAQYVEKNSQDDDAIMFHSGSMMSPFRYYYRGNHELKKTEEVSIDNLLKQRRSWLIVSPTSDNDEGYWRELARTHYVVTNRLFPKETGIRVLLLACR
jgi:uncharacterized membrane protein